MEVKLFIDSEEDTGGMDQVDTYKHVKFLVRARMLFRRKSTGQSE